jgi:hypothetical protein
MKVITKRDLILSVGERWCEQYAYSIRDPKERQHKHVMLVRDRLRKLNLETCEEGEVLKIVGNAGWTALICDQCEAHVTTVAEFQTAYGDETTMRICMRCVLAAAEAIGMIRDGVAPVVRS